MLMRSSAHFTSTAAGAREFTTGGQLTIRERIVETNGWTISIPAIATLSVSPERQSRFLRGAILAVGALSALAGLANYALAFVWPGLGLLIASLMVAATCAVFSVRTKGRYVLAFTANDGSRCTVTSDNETELRDIRAFLAEKINRQDCRACRVFNLNGSRDENGGALAMNEALRVISERADATAVAVEAAETSLIVPPAVEPSTSRPSGSDGVDYVAVLGQVTDLHRFYERHPQAAHIRERLGEMELLMRSGTPSAAQRERVRELALDLSNIMSAYPHMTQLFSRVTSLAA